MGSITVLANRRVHYRQKLYQALSVKEDCFYTEEIRIRDLPRLFESLTRTKQVLLIRDPSIVLNWIVLFYSLLRNYKTIILGGWFTDSRCANKMRLIMSRLASKNVFYSERIRFDFVLRGLDCAKTSSLPNNKYAVYQLHNTSRHSVALLGSLTARKGYLEFLTVLDSKLEKTIQIEVIGDGPMMDIMRTTSLNFIKLHFHGEMNHQGDVNRILGRCFGVISPSQVGLTVVDSFANGCPVFALSGAISGGEKESIIDGFNGYLSKGNSELVDQLISVMNDPALKENLVNNAYFSFKELYNWDNYVKQFEFN